METVITVSALGALIGLIISIIFIFLNLKPFYSLFIGALIGGLVGGASLSETIQLMTQGSQGMVTSILRILAAGILAGVLIQSGAAKSIAYSIVKALGTERALLAIVISTTILTFVGVFIDIAVITVAPIAIEIGRQSGISKTGILIAMIGGGKSGNIMSPNPNAIAVSDAFGVPLTNVMLAGVIPALIGIVVTYFVASQLKGKGTSLLDNLEEENLETQDLPSLFQSLSGPIVAIILLSLRPLFNIVIDPMIALPLGGLVGAFVLGKFDQIIEFSSYGIEKMTNVAIILLGTGLIAGIISNSTLGDVIVEGVQALGLPAFLLAPISGILMSAATASTTSGSAVASSVFGNTIISSGVSPLSGAAMVHAGATVLDHLPHGSFFHATGGSVSMKFKERLGLIPFESLIGLVLTIVSALIYGVIFK